MGVAIPAAQPPLAHSRQEFVWEASHYLVRQVFKSLQEMFSGTRAIQVRPGPPLPGVASWTGLVLSLSPPLQRWLAESARLIARTGSAVEWVTPLGIPIIQPYHHDSKVLVRAPSPPPTPPNPPRGRPHASGLSPNNPADQRWDPEPHLQQQWGHQPVSAWGGAGLGWGAAE